MAGKTKLESQKQAIKYSSTLVVERRIDEDYPVNSNRSILHTTGGVDIDAQCLRRQDPSGMHLPPDTGGLPQAIVVDNEVNFSY